MEWILTQLNAGDVPPGIEDIPGVVEAVKRKYNLVELEEQLRICRQCRDAQNRMLHQAGYRNW